MKTQLTPFRLMFLLVPALIIGFTSCEDDDDDEDITVTQITPNDYQLTFTMAQKVNGMDLQMNTSNKPYANEKGQAFNVSRLRYLISDIALHKGSDSVLIEGYHFVDATDSATFTYSPSTQITEGSYDKISFNFGFDSQDNQSNAYSDLNLANWAWPGMLGGGYHYMQLEGDYDSSGTSKFFATHMGTARDNSVSPPTFENNHFRAAITSNIQVSANNQTLELVMNVEQWYENPFQWDFNVYNAPIMPVYMAQKRLQENGPSVFTLGN